MQKESSVITNNTSEARLAFTPYIASDKSQKFFICLFLYLFLALTNKFTEYMFKIRIRISSMIAPYNPAYAKPWGIARNEIPM